MASWSQGKTSVTKFKPQAKPQVPIEPVSCLGRCSCLAALCFQLVQMSPRMEEPGHSQLWLMLIHLFLFKLYQVIMLT